MRFQEGFTHSKLTSVERFPCSGSKQQPKIVHNITAAVNDLAMPPSSIVSKLFHPHAEQGHQPVAEFLYQVTRMLVENNQDIIEFMSGRIVVYSPKRLEKEVLHKYFRHSKFSSFQRQLNYFGFRKLAGKRKMAPCSYVNGSLTSDLRSLLTIKVSHLSSHTPHDRPISFR